MSEMNGDKDGVQPYAFVGPCTLAFVVEGGPELDGKKTVLLRCESATGSAVYLMPHEEAARLGASLVTRAKMAATGLTIVGEGGLDDV